MDLLGSSRGWSLKCPEGWSTTPVKMMGGLQHYSRLRELDVQPGEEKVLETPCSIFLYLKGALQEIWRGSLCHGM